MTVNDGDTLYFEKSTGINADVCGTSPGSYYQNIDYQMAVGLGASFESEYLYGLSERESSLLLKETSTTDPYRTFNIDYYAHQQGDPRGEYGSIPYVTAHSAAHDSSLLWVNSADTWTDLLHLKQGQMTTNFVSESGVLELFMFTTESPKKQLKNLATITGYAPLPLIESLGYHFSKYAEVSADIMMQRDRDFENYNFPVDFLWMDILYAKEYEYFTFDPVKFPPSKLTEMNHQIEDHKRRLVAITDPHIAKKSNNFVYTDGVNIENMSSTTQVFVRSCFGGDFEGDCWPGNSVWIDFLNDQSQTYWEGLYEYDVFKGTTYIYHQWNDMNEPSVFNSEEGTMPLQMQHMLSNGTVVKHRDVHNIYGALQLRSTHRGTLARDKFTRREFILTRSYYTGSQKHGAYWTGDNVAADEEILGGLYMLLSGGVSGMIFGGSDIPGYAGVPPQSLYITSYQSAMFYPFFRAHCSIDNTAREPWLQTQQV